MPFFTWSGIDASGSYQRGNSTARSSTELLNFLTSKNIAVLSHKQIKPTSCRFFNYAYKANFFKQLASLVHAGIYINQALELVALQEKSSSKRELLTEFFLEVEQGKTLSATLAQYPSLFDSITLQTIEAGQHSGLIKSLETLAHYYEQVDFFRNKLRQALIMPLITGIFFIVITLIIFLGILPTFISLFESLNQQLPPITQYMLKVSNFIGSWYALIGALGVGAIFITYYILPATHTIKQTFQQWMIWNAPCSHLMREIYLCRFFQALIVLLESGSSMKVTLETLSHATTNPLNKRIQQVVNKVLTGTSLEEALTADNELFSADVCALVRIGQETGQLTLLLDKVIKNYQHKIYQTITFYTTLIQPLLLMVLGIWIGLLIVGIYLPIFNLSYALS